MSKKHDAQKSKKYSTAKVNKRAKKIRKKKAIKRLRVLSFKLQLGYFLGLGQVGHWLLVKYGITAIEITFGSLDFTKARRIEVIRAYIAQAYAEGAKLTVEGMKAAFAEAAVARYCQYSSIDRSRFDKCTSKRVKEQFVRRAEEYAYNLTFISTKICNTNEEIMTLAKESCNNFESDDLRRGTIASRNERKRNLARDILSNLSQPVEKRVTIKSLAIKHRMDEDTVSKHIKLIKDAYYFGVKVDEHILNEKKRGRKPHGFSVISEDAFNGILFVLEATPDDFGFNYSTWTGEAIKEYLKVYHSIDVDIKYLYSFLGAHDIESKAASRKNPKANPEEIEEFKRGLMKKFKDAINNNEMIIFLDETHIQKGDKQYGYALRGKPAYYSHTLETRHCAESVLAMIGFNFVKIFKQNKTVTAEVYIECLRQLRMALPTQKFVIYRDNASVHRADIIDEYLQKSGSWRYIRFEELPRYSPDLNPVELFNNELKGFIRKYPSLNKDEVINLVEKFINKFQDDKGICTKKGAKKARQYFKGKQTFFIYEAYLMAMKAVMQAKRAQMRLIHRETNQYLVA